MSGTETEGEPCKRCGTDTEKPWITPLVDGLGSVVCSHTCARMVEVDNRDGDTA